MIGRIVLETCANVEEAISLLKEIPHRRSFSYVLLNQTGSPSWSKSRQEKSFSINPRFGTNHFDVLTHENRYQIDDSLQRYQAMKDHESHFLNANSAFQMMNSTDNGVFSKKYGAWAGTLHTAGYFPNSRSAGLPLEEINDSLSLILINGLRVKG